jgi:hypothetical protein
MSRAILAYSGSAAARPFALVSHMFSAVWHELTRHAGAVYRPERHYMRGPGPAWHAKHGRFPAA